MGSKSGSPPNRMRHVLSALVQNQPGVLAHVSGMFASRGFNIESLAVGETEDAHLSRITIVVNGDDRLLEQIRKQLDKIVTVVKVLDISKDDYVERDLMLIKVDAPALAAARAPKPGPDLPRPDRRRRVRPDDGRDLRPGEEDRGLHRGRPPLRDSRAGPDRPDRAGPRDRRRARRCPGRAGGHRLPRGRRTFEPLTSSWRRGPVDQDFDIMPRYSSRESPRLPDDPRKFFRVATQRFAEAQFLHEGERYAAAIYIAGYSVECGLKALILSTEPESGQRILADSFRGSGWHNFHRLIEVFIGRGGSRPPPMIAKALTYVNDEWSVELRYLAGERPFREANRFIDSTDLILGWIKGRL